MVGRFFQNGLVLLHESRSEEKPDLNSLPSSSALLICNNSDWFGSTTLPGRAAFRGLKNIDTACTDEPIQNRDLKRQQTHTPTKVATPAFMFKILAFSALSMASSTVRTMALLKTCSQLPKSYQQIFRYLDLFNFPVYAVEGLPSFVVFGVRQDEGSPLALPE